jgi:hypothetical protein
MEERIVLLTKFLQSLRNEVLEYYDKTHMYLRDLVSYKNIDLNEVTLGSNEESLNNTLLSMLKAVKTGLNTIGVPIDKLSKIQNNYLKEVSTKRMVLSNYGAFLELYLKSYINKILFEILLEFLLDMDVKKMETLMLFKLIPQSFIDRLREFKETYVNSRTKTFFTFPGIEENLNFSDLSINIKSLNLNPNKTIQNTMNKEEEINEEEKKTKEEPNILTQLHEAKKDFIETLKTPKIVLTSSLERLDNTILGTESPKIMENANLSSSSMTQTNHTTFESEKKNFLDYFGNLPTVHSEFLNKFRINITNLLNSRIVNPDFLDLEIMFYYISILKMAAIEFPFAPIEIIDFLRNYTNEMTFSTSRYSLPDSISIFYGLSIITELNLIHRTNIINLNSTEEVLRRTITNFIPNKLRLNYYTFLSLKLLAKNEIISLRRNGLMNQLLNLDVLNMKEFNPTLDIFSHLSILTMVDNKLDLSGFNTPYIDELKKRLTSKGSIGDLITDSARALLILDLLDLKDQESVLCSRLLQYIMNTTDFFTLDNLEKDFNWRIDKVAYKIELRMLFWALLACAQYSPDNIINL